ncbi:transcriptional antiterminator NusG [Gracilibacillus alcaliphilus]|nr:transcriptional antiterminator NusG [Gracilibacillus alcaliphilus]
MKKPLNEVSLYVKGREGRTLAKAKMEKRWYVVHTYSGYENKVKTNLEKRLESMGMEDKIFRVLVPEDEETEIKNGKKKVAKKKVFPGYVLAEMIMTDDSWYVVRNTPGVTGFVGSAGSGSKPTPLLEEEVDMILKRMGYDQPVVEIDFELKETVEVTDGPFNGFSGKIEKIDADKQKVKVHVDMFGRETPVELDFSQVRKLS